MRLHLSETRLMVIQPNCWQHGQLGDNRLTVVASHPDERRLEFPYLQAIASKWLVNWNLINEMGLS